jgi:hypothetical protein
MVRKYLNIGAKSDFIPVTIGIQLKLEKEFWLNLASNAN